MSRRQMAALVIAGVLTGARPARADLTGFIGATTTPENRQVRGFAFGAGLLAIGWEFELAHTVEDLTTAAPTLRTYTGNLLIQTPFAIHGFQPYATVGAGLCRETLGALTQTGLAPNSGVGVKISLAGPLRLRVDYRTFRLGSGALYSPAHRIYAGLNLKF